MKVLGLDQSTANTGYCVVEDGKIIDTGIVKIRENKNLYDKIILMADGVERLIFKHQPDYLCLEDIYFNPGMFYAFRGLALLRGALIWLWWMKSFSIPVVISCTSARVRLGIKGNAKKPEVVEAINSKFNLKLDNDNIADAVVVAVVGHDMIIKGEKIKNLENSQIFYGGKNGPNK